jgi:polysaccharide biosynthesis protein PslE
MAEWSPYLPSWDDVQRAFGRHWPKGLAAAAVALLVISAVTFLLPRTYQSEAKLFVKVGRESLTLDPTATTGQTVSIYESRENEINSILEVLRSREVFEGVVDLLGVDALNGGQVPDLPSPECLSAENPAPAHRGREVSQSVREQAVTQLEKSVRIWSPKRSSVVIVQCQAGSPRLAQGIVAAILLVYRQIHADVNSTKGSYDFFVEQERVLRESWQGATARLRDAKDHMGLSTLVGRRTMLEGQLTDVAQKQLAAESEIAAATAKIAALKDQLAATERFTETTRAENANAAADNMRGNLYQLQIREKELLARYTPAHPQVIEIQEQVASLERLLTDEGRTRVQTTSTLNPAWAQLESSLLLESSTLESLRSRLVALSKQHATLMASLRTLNQQEIELTRLQQGVELAEKSYYETAQRLEQARIGRQLAEEQITNVNVFQPATFVGKAVAPKRSLLLALGLIVSVGFGVATIFAFAWLERHFSSVAEITARLRLPVIATLPSPQW